MNIILETPQFEQENKENADVFHETIKKYDQQMDELFHDSDVRELITTIANDSGVTVADMSNENLSEDEFMDSALTAFNFRKGAERDAIKNLEFSEHSLLVLEIVKEKFGLTIDSTPKNPDFDVALVYGGAGRSPKSRLDYLLKKIDTGEVNTDVIVMMGSERPLNMKPVNGATEVDRAGTAGYDSLGVAAKTENDLMLNTASVALDIPTNEWMVVKGYDSDIPEAHHYQNDYSIAYAEKDGKKVYVLSAPMIGDERLGPRGKRRNRTNTTDTLLMVAKMLKEDIADGEVPRMLGVSNAIFAGEKGFQKSAQESRLAPLGIESETIGFNRETEGVADWTPAQYVQEVLSSIRHIRQARDYLYEQETVAQ